MDQEPEDPKVLRLDVAPLAASLQVDALPTFQYADDPQAPEPVHFEDETGAAFEPDPAPPAPWEAELETFWQNVLANVSAKVETPIHNFLREETEALKARLKAVL